MEIQSIKLVYFSPTGTTKAIVQAIANGINHSRMEFVDITKPFARKQIVKTKSNELLLIAVPVYMGRIPSLLSDWLHTIQAQQTPVVCVVVYGNRAYDNALLELTDILKACGCIPFAGATFIGEHSFSSDELPSSVGRPDESDVLQAVSFGWQINEKLNSVSNNIEIDEINVPGNSPYGGVTELWKIDFIAISDKCTMCGICADGCPTGAINIENSKMIDIQKCTLCCACIKHCPQNAKSIKPGLMRDAAIRCTNFVERKEPEYFFYIQTSIKN